MDSHRKQNQKATALKVIVWKAIVTLCSSEDNTGRLFYSDSKNWEFKVVLN